jgi:hypothetical protein
VIKISCELYLLQLFVISIIQQYFLPSEVLSFDAYKLDLLLTLLNYCEKPVLV